VCGTSLDNGWKTVNKTKECYFSYEQFVPFYKCKWCFKMEYVWSKYFFLDVYLGWKQKTMNINGRTMIAMRINPFKGVN